MSPCIFLESKCGEVTFIVAAAHSPDIDLHLGTGNHLSISESDIECVTIDHRLVVDIETIHPEPELYGEVVQWKIPFRINRFANERVVLRPHLHIWCRLYPRFVQQQYIFREYFFFRNASVTHYSDRDCISYPFFRTVWGNDNRGRLGFRLSAWNDDVLVPFKVLVRQYGIRSFILFVVFIQYAGVDHERCV